MSKHEHDDKKRGWIGVDLDGTLAVYTTWQGIEHIGEPIMPMVDRVKRWLSEGYDVRIFTARVSESDGTRDTRKVRKVIEDWCMQHLNETLPITNVKDFEMHELYDDRAVQVAKNTGKVIGYSTRGTDRPGPCYAAQTAEMWTDPAIWEAWVTARLAEAEKKGAVKTRISWADVGPKRVHLLEAWDKEYLDDELPSPGFLLTGLGLELLAAENS